MKYGKSNIKNIIDSILKILGSIKWVESEDGSNKTVIDATDGDLILKSKKGKKISLESDIVYLNNAKITNMSEPEEDQDASTKKYVDTEISKITSNEIDLPEHTALLVNSVTEIMFGYVSSVPYSAQTLKNVYLTDLEDNVYKAIMSDKYSFTANPSTETVIILSSKDYTNDETFNFDITNDPEQLKEYSLKENEIRIILSYDTKSVYGNGYGYGAMFSRNANKKSSDNIQDYYLGSQSDINNSRKVYIKIDSLGNSVSGIKSMSMTTNCPEKLIVKTDSLEPVENSYSNSDEEYIHTPKSKTKGSLLYSDIPQEITATHILEKNIVSLSPAKSDNNLLRLKEFNAFNEYMLKSMFDESPEELKEGDYIDISFSGSASYGTGYCGYVNIKDTVRRLEYKAYKVSSNAFNTTGGTKVIAVLTSDSSKKDVSYSDSVADLESYDVLDNEILLEISFTSPKQYSAKYGYGAMLEYWGSVSNLCYDFYMGPNLDMQCPFKLKILKKGSGVKVDTFQIGAPNYWAPNLVMTIIKNNRFVANFTVSSGTKVEGRDGALSGSVYMVSDTSLKPLKVVTSEGIVNFNGRVYLNVSSESITDGNQVINKNYFDSNIKERVASSINKLPVIPDVDVSGMDIKNIKIKISANTSSSSYVSGDTVVVSNLKVKLKGDSDYLKPIGVEVTDRQNQKIGLNLEGVESVYDDSNSILTTTPDGFTASSVDLSTGSNLVANITTNGAYNYSGVYEISYPFRNNNKKYCLFLSNDGLKNPYYQAVFNSSKQIESLKFQLFGASLTNPDLYSKECNVQVYVENTLIKSFSVKNDDRNDNPVEVELGFKDGKSLISVVDAINNINKNSGDGGNIAELLSGSGKPSFSLNPNKKGSLYSDIENHQVWMCIDNTVGANKWINIISNEEVKPNLMIIEITCDVSKRAGQYGGCMSGVKIGFDNGYASTKQIVKGLNSGKILLISDGQGNLRNYSEVSSITTSGNPEEIKADVTTTGIYNDPSYHNVTNIFKEYLGNANQCSLWSSSSSKELKISLLYNKLPNKIIYVGNGYYGQTSVSNVQAKWYYVDDSGNKIEGALDNILEVSVNDSETNDGSYIYAFNIN